MSESTDTDTAITPEGATAQRGALMGDAGFRQRAAAGGAEWQQIAKLDGIIAAGREAAAAADEAEQARASEPKAKQQQPTDDDEVPLTFEPPESPAAYGHLARDAQMQGLKPDPLAERELAQAFHGAGVDVHMAQLMYTAATTAALRPPTPVQAATEYHASETALRKAWGGDFEKNLAAANLEARRVFAAMPASITGGASFKDWCAASGLANNRVLVENFYLRAKRSTG